MATPILDELCIEGSTYPIDAEFRDETGALVVPNAGLVWQLTDLAEPANVINGRTAVPIASATTVTVVLHGADTMIGDNGIERLVVLRGTYNSSLGNNLELVAAVQFYITPVPGVP
jgi:hypothetical protein